MVPGSPFRVVSLLLLLLRLLAAPAPAAAAPDLIALTDDGRLLRFPPDRPADATPVAMDGAEGLIALDLRPSDGRLYAVTSTNDVYVLDLGAGSARLVSSLTVPFDGAQRSGIDFNPQTDRCRMVAASGQNVRVNVELGATAVDGPLAYVAGDPSVGRKPAMAAAAYTNNRPGAATTRLFDVDADRDVLVLQDPPNDGGLVTVGALGIDVGPLAGFDIATWPDGRELAWLASGGTLYGIDLATGKATAVGPIGSAADAQIVGLAAVALP